MITIEQICKQIHMPDEVTKIIIMMDNSLDEFQLQVPIHKLFHPNTWSDGLEELNHLYSNLYETSMIRQLNSINDPVTENIKVRANGFFLLTCMLKASLTTYKNYIDKGIEEEIYNNTMACFSRFVKEHKVSYGVYGFDREWWTSRQIAMELFRIGELEYEFITKDEHQFISIHIPSDAKISISNCRESIRLAKEFFNKYYPQYQYEHFICHSWLLSPNLKEVLEPDSKILHFQDAFEITEFDPNSKEFVEWVYKNPNLTVDDFPEDTSLQRRIKAYLIKGGTIGDAFGFLKEDAFLQG